MPLLLNVVHHRGEARLALGRVSEHGLELRLGLSLRLHLSVDLLKLMLVGWLRDSLVRVAAGSIGTTTAAASRGRVLLGGDASGKVEIQDGDHGKIAKDIPPEATVPDRAEASAQVGIVLHAPDTSGTKDASRDQVVAEASVAAHGNDLEDNKETACDENDASIQVVKGIRNLLEEAVSPSSNGGQIGENHNNLGAAGAIVNQAQVN